MSAGSELRHPLIPPDGSGSTAIAINLKRSGSRAPSTLLTALVVSWRELERLSADPILSGVAKLGLRPGLQSFVGIGKLGTAELGFGALLDEEREPRTKRNCPTRVAR